MHNGWPSIIEAHTIILPIRGPNERSTDFEMADKGI